MLVIDLTDDVIAFIDADVDTLCRKSMVSMI